MNHLIRFYIVCHSASDFKMKPLFASVDMSKFKDRRVHFRHSGMKELGYVLGVQWYCLSESFVAKVNSKRKIHLMDTPSFRAYGSGPGTVDPYFHGETHTHFQITCILQFVYKKH